MSSFRETDPPLILIITRETPRVPQATTKWHFILQKIQGSALERVGNRRVRVMIMCLEWKKWISGAYGF